jgi:hypothetical protein
MKNMKSTKKKYHQDVYLRFGRLAAGLLHVLHALHGEKWFRVMIAAPLPLQGARNFNFHTQGVALGYFPAAPLGLKTNP